MNRLSPVAAIVGIVCFWAGQQTPQVVESAMTAPAKTREIVDVTETNFGKCHPACQCTTCLCAVPLECSPDDKPIEPTPATVTTVPSPPVAAAVSAPSPAATGFYYTSGCANGSCSPRAYSQPVYTQRSYQPQYQYQRPARRGLFGRRR